MDKEKLVELAKDVAEKRQDVEVAKKERTSAEELTTKTTQGMHFQLCTAHVESEQKVLTEAEDQLKSAVLEVYEETSERKPITGTEVKIFKSLRYDAAKALEWCREKATGLLIVNKKPFEKTAVEMGAPVEVIEIAKCTLAKDLSSYLEPAKESAA